MRPLTLSLLLALTPVSILAGCAGKAGAAPDPFASKVQEAHGGPGWYSTPGIETRITVEFGGTTILDGTMLFEPRTGRCRVDLADGGVMVFDGEQAWASEGVERARFHTLTWPYFMGVPWKLQDEGAELTGEGDRPLGDRSLPTARLTFASGTGDTPDDWYVLFSDPDHHRLGALAYIVTYGKSLDDAEVQPSLALYGDYGEVQGLLLPGRLDLHYWEEATGPGEAKGWATFEETRVLTPPSGSFERPEGSIADELPE